MGRFLSFFSFLAVILLLSPLAARADDIETYNLTFNSQITGNVGGTGSVTVDWSQYTSGSFGGGYWAVTAFSYDMSPVGGSTASYDFINNTYPNVTAEIQDFFYPFLFFQDLTYPGGDPMNINIDIPGYEYDNIDYGYVSGLPLSAPISATPEPSSLALLATGLSGLAAFGRKRLFRG